MGVQPASVRPATSRMLSIAAGASCIEKPNFEPAWPVEIFAWVSPRTSGVTRMSTGCGRRGRRARPRRCSSRSRSISSRLSITISPTRSAQRRRELGLGLGVAVHHDALGRKAGASARCSSPPEATSHHSPSCGEQLEHRGAGEGLGGEHDREVLVAAARPAATKARARARRSSSATTIGRRAELVRELDHVAAADLEMAVLVEAAAERIDVREAVAVAMTGDYRGPRGRSDERRQAALAQRRRRLRREPPEPARPLDERQPDALQLRARSARRSTSLVAADELDQQALEPATTS